MSDLRGTETVPVAPRFYSVAKVAELLGMSPMTVYRAIADLAIAEQTVVDASGWVPVQHGSAG